MLLPLFLLLIIKPGLTRELLFSSNNTRPLIWRSALKMWVDHPLLGVGLGNFKLHYPRYRLQQERQIASMNIQVDHTHNEFLQTLSDTGFVGFIVLAYFLFILFKLCRSALAQRGHPDFPLLLGLVGVILGVLVHSTVSFPLQNPASFFGFILAIAFLVKLTGQQTTIEVNLTVAVRFIYQATLLSFFLFTAFFFSKRLTNDYCFTQSQAYQQQNRIEESIPLLERAVTAFPYNFRPWWILGFALNKLDRFPEAVKAYRKGNALSPNYYLTHYQLGNTYQALSRFAEAITEYDKALFLVPEYTQAQQAKEIAKQRQVSAVANPASQVPDLQETLNAPITPIPDDIKQMIENAQEYETVQQYEKALIEYRAVYSLEPTMIMVRYNMGMVYLKMNRLEEALAEFSLVAETQQLPPLPRSDALSQMGYINFIKKDYDQAENLLLQAAATNPKSLRAHLFLGNLYYSLQRKEEALRAWQAALAIDPGNAGLKNNIATLLNELAKK